MKLKDSRRHGGHDGRTSEPEYLSWVRMQRRCYEPNYKGYKNYGGRGITVCDEWRQDYRAFVRDVGRKPTPQHSLDRIDNNGNYEPTNCRWATSLEQKQNRRSVREITFNGETKCLAEWSRQTGFSPSVLNRRLALLPIHLALDPKHHAPRTEPERFWPRSPWPKPAAFLDA